MAHRPVPLAQLRVDSPCTRDWDAMPGDGRTRFCDECGKHVHNLSQMTAAEAERLVSTTAAADRVCVRYEVSDDDGGVRTLDYAPPRRPRFRSRIWLPLAFLGSAAAAVAHVLLAPKVPPPAMGKVVVGGATPSPRSIVMGDVAPGPRPTTPPAPVDGP